ncbi:hypothetical protein [Dactylosporangium sp. CA-092794]|uniref:hypothetical protein n=1 Tax=Dactylosporangium sp. CA-092794 TaxID=3239929 RepID=UPI003D943860
MEDGFQLSAKEFAMPIPEPDARLRELDYFVGAWQAAGRFHETPFGPAKPIAMRIVASSEDRGFWRVVRTEELPSADNPTPLTARYLWGYDAAAGEFVAEWFDSNGGRATQRSAGWDGDRLAFLGAMTMGGYTVPLRDTFTRSGPDRYHHIGEVDLGGGWQAVDDEDVTRVQPPR